MKMIKPIVNIAKISNDFDTFVLGYNGVITDGNNVLDDAKICLQNLIENKKNIIIISNTAKRISEVVEVLLSAGINVAKLACIMTAGEMLHYMLKNQVGEYSALGNIYYQLGSAKKSSVFSKLDYMQTQNIEKAHFLYMEEVQSPEDTIDLYIPLLQQALTLSMPFVCAGNNTSVMQNGKICLSPAMIAEQYAVMGGKVITIGKPDDKIFNYCLSDIAKDSSILVVGDDIATDIKGAASIDASSVLISKGVHINYLGEGYIPDVAKTRELSSNYDVSPDYVISNLRW